MNDDEYEMFRKEFEEFYTSFGNNNNWPNINELEDENAQFLDDESTTQFLRCWMWVDTYDFIDNLPIKED